MTHSETTTIWPLPPGDGAGSSEWSGTACREGAAGRPGMINGRYSLLRQLGSGGVGSVFLVADVLRQDRLLALKRLRPDAVDRKRIRTLQNEFLVLSLLRHPGLAEVYDFGKDARTSDLFFTSEFVDGVTLMEVCRRIDLGRPKHLRRFLDLLAQILRALEFIHSRGLVHGDIKPANILVTGEKSPAPPIEWENLRAKLIDFGLVRTEKEFGGRSIMGTIQYIAPEVISGSQIDRRTDLYSVGAVLYCLVTGEFPFQGDSELATLKSHLECVPRPPRELVPALPQGLNDIILRLLTKEPAERFQSAAEVIAALQRIVPAECPLETVETSASYLLYPRPDTHERHARALCKACLSSWRVQAGHGERLEDELAQFQHERMQSLPAATTQALGRIVLIHGERGIGKQALVLRFKGIVQVRGGTFLYTDCAEEKTPVGGAGRKDFENILREIAATEHCASTEHHTLGVAESVLRSGLLDRVDPQTEGLNHIAGKIARYLLQLSVDQPMVLHVHGGERMSAFVAGFLRVLADCTRENAVPGYQLMVSVAVCDEEVHPDSPAARLLALEEFSRSVSHLQLERLDVRGVAQVLDFMFPGNDFPEAFVRRIAASSDGNPGAIAEVCRHLLRERRMERHVSGWSVSPEALSATFPVQLYRALKRTILGLPSNVLKLAIAYAYLGSGSELGLGAAFARMPTEGLEDAIGLLVEKKILRRVPDSSPPRYAFAYQSAQDILYELVPPEERPGFHARAGLLTKAFYRQAQDRDARSLARHFLNAGLLDDALQYGLAAVRGYIDEFRLDLALDTYVRLFSLARSKGLRLPSERCHDLAVLFRRSGKHREARRILYALYEENRAAETESHVARICVHLGEIDRILGDFAQAHHWIEKALELTDHPEDRHCRKERADALLVKAQLAFVQGRYEESAEHCLSCRAISERARDLDTLARIQLLLSENFFALGKRSAAEASCLKALRFFDSLTDALSREETIFSMGKLYKIRDMFSAARTEFLCCVELRGQMGALDAEGEALLELGGLDLFLGKVREASCAFKRAVKIFETTGNRPALLKASNLRAESLRLTGSYEDARRVVESARELSRGLGNPVGESEVLLVLGKMVLDAGELERAEEFLKRAYPTSPSDPRAQLKLLDFRCQLFHNRGDFELLLGHSVQGVHLARDNGLPLHEAQFLEHRSTVHLRLGNLADARADAERLRTVARQYRLPLSMGRAFLVDALVAASDGDAEGARHCFSRAKTIFLDASSERDLTRLYAHLGSFLMEERKYAEAFWLLEEGLYLAKKLRLDYWRALYHYLSGLLRLKAPEGTGQEARALFEKARKHAERAPYGDLLWKVRQKLVALDDPARDSTVSSRDR